VKPRPKQTSWVAHLFKESERERERERESEMAMWERDGVRRGEMHLTPLGCRNGLWALQLYLASGMIRAKEEKKRRSQRGKCRKEKSARQSDRLG